MKSQPVRDIGRSNGYRRNPILERIELPSGDDGHAVAVGFIRGLGGGVEVFRRHPLCRSLPEEATAGKDVRPELFGRVRAGVDATHTDDGNRVKFARRNACHGYSSPCFVGRVFCLLLRIEVRLEVFWRKFSSTESIVTNNLTPSS